MEIQTHSTNTTQKYKTDANENATDAGGNDQPTFVLAFLKNIKEARLKFSQGALTVL